MKDFIKKLPLDGKKIFVKAYEKTNDFNLALATLKQRYKLVSDKWVVKKSMKVDTVMKKSGIFSPKFTWTLPITSTSVDSQGDSVDAKLLEKLVNEDRIDTKGDIDHLKLEGKPIFQGLFKLINKEYTDNTLMATIGLDKSHNMYNHFIKNKLYDKITGASAEFYGDVYDDNNMLLDCNRLGWTMTLNETPVNSDCRV